MNEQTLNKMRAALELADGVLLRLGGFGDAGCSERWRQLKQAIEAGDWDKHFSENDGNLTALDAEARVLLIFIGVFDESAELVAALMRLNEQDAAKEKLWDQARDALALADDISCRWGGFDGFDAEQWRELHDDIEARRCGKHFHIAATAGGYSLEPKTSAARTLLLFMDILEEITKKA